MPIYEYSCLKCNAHVEVLQKVSDKPLSRHDKCGGKLEKEWSRTGFQFKGTGWYVTDYAGKKTDAKDGKDVKEKADNKESKDSKSATETAAPSSKSDVKEKGGEKSKGVKSNAGASGGASSKG
jgi:putative FmdB family regulatory protein